MFCDLQVIPGKAMGHSQAIAQLSFLLRTRSPVRCEGLRSFGGHLGCVIEATRQLAGQVDVAAGVCLAHRLERVCGEVGVEQEVELGDPVSEVCPSLGLHARPDVALGKSQQLDQHLGPGFRGHGAVLVAEVLVPEVFLV